MASKRLPGEPKRPVPPQLVGKNFSAHPENAIHTGRPKDFDQLRKMVLEMGNKEAEFEIEVGKGKKKKIQKLKMTMFQRILMDWFSSQSFEKQQSIMQHGFGKVPDAIDITSKGKSIVIPPEKVAERVVQLLALAQQRKDKENEK